ncbi:hypothetical protein V8C86DRAFT_2449249 [Haematococcus lacustris]
MGSMTATCLLPGLCRTHAATRAAPTCPPPRPCRGQQAAPKGQLPTWTPPPQPSLPGCTAPQTPLTPSPATPPATRQQAGPAQWSGRPPCFPQLLLALPPGRAAGGCSSQGVG